ncbi:MAG: IS1595 family transposase, partial [Sphingomicrobium sp.]
MEQEPRTLMEAVRYFLDPDVALKHMVELRWPNGVACPTCGRTDVRYISTRRLWECKEQHPRKQFSAKVGTIFGDSALPLDKWFVAIWMVANCKNGISSYEMARALGITQKSAWHMNHRIRLAMRLGSIEKMDGPAEIDEAFVGGEPKNMHRVRRATKAYRDKAAIIGILERSRGENPSRV